jgi:hypothetical protein
MELFNNNDDDYDSVKLIHLSARQQDRNKLEASTEQNNSYNRLGLHILINIMW